MTRAGRASLVIVCTMLGTAASGCSTQARRVDCEGRLEPINAPALKERETSPKATERAPL